MALTSCRECGKQISDQAAACPHCGAPVRLQAQPTSPPKKASNPGCLSAVLVLICAVIVLGALKSCGESPNDSSGVSEPAITETPAPEPTTPAQLQAWKQQVDDAKAGAPVKLAAAESIVAKAPGSVEAAEVRPLIPDLQKAVEKYNEDLKDRGSWDYFSSTDPMSDKPVMYARVKSDNTFLFDFPYQGAQHATLSLRRHPKWGKDVILSIEKGQLLCSSYSCPVRVRFDDEPARMYEGNEPADNSSESIFIPAYSTFASKLAKAKRVRIEVNVFKQGTLTTEFTVKGFDGAQL